MTAVSTDPSSLVGPAAGVGTSVLWAATALLFTAGTRRIGATRVNLLRLITAAALLVVTSRWLLGAWLPAVSTGQAVDLALSGVVGLTLCDQALFVAFGLVGPRLVLLVNTTAPLFALTFGAAFLGERVGPLALLGIACTLGGVAWVVLEKRETTVPRAALLRGIGLAVFGASTQALGAYFGKRGIGHGVLPREEHLDPLGATAWRMVAGLAGMLVLVALRGAWARARARPLPDGPPTIDPAALDTTAPGDPARQPWSALPAINRRRGIQLTLAAAVLGPYLGVWLSVVAFDLTELGVAQTLCSLSPVLVLPLTRAVYGEAITPRAVLGALVAVGGSALLFVT